MKNATWLNDEQSTKQETLVDERTERNDFNPFVDDEDDPHALITQLKAEESNTRRTQFADYLWAFVPLALLPFLQRILFSIFHGTSDGVVVGANLSYPHLILALVTTILVIVGVRRKSELLQAHWLGHIPGYAFVVFVFLFDAYFSTPMWITGIGSILMAGSLGWLGRLIHKNRRDHLKVAFMSLPILMTILNLFNLAFTMRAVDMEAFDSWIMMTEVLGVVGMGIGLGLFFLGRNRKTKWAGLFAPILTGLLGSLILTGFAPTFAIPLWLGGLAVPTFFYWRERRNRPKEKQPDDLDTAAPSPA